MSVPVHVCIFGICLGCLRVPQGDPAEIYTFVHNLILISDKAYCYQIFKLIIFNFLLAYYH